MIIVLSTYPDRKSADQAARSLVKSGLSACVNILRIESSVYRWEGKLKEGAEFLLIIKAGSEDYDKLESAIKKSHPYELPEIIRMQVDGGFQPYLDWVDCAGFRAPETGPRSRRS